MSEELHEIQVEAPVQVRDLAKREVDIRIMPWDVWIETVNGPEAFARGAFSDVQPSKVKLMGLEHEVHLGLGQTGQPVLTRRPMGKAISLEDREDAQYGTFRVSATASGDEYLALAVDGVVDGISVEFGDVPDGYEVVNRNGRRGRYYRKATLPAVSPTYRPAYEDARVLAVRSEENAVTEVKEDPAPPEPKEPDKEPEVVQARSELQAKSDATRVLDFMEKLSDRMGKMEEQARSFTVPSAPGVEQHKVTLGDWASVALRALAGERMSDNDPQYRVVAELITSDNIGVVPHSHMTELIGVIDRSRPFLATTRQLPTPTTGMDIVVPTLGTRPTTAIQAAEKDELASTTTTITNTTFSAVTIGGVGDISLQLLRRSSPSYLDLYVELLAEAMAIDAEAKALTELFDDMGGSGAATPMDPNDLALGAAYQTSFNAIRRPPDTIWLSTEAVGEFIDAQASGTNAPLYSTLRADITAAGGLAGTISGLRAVHVPALDTHGAFALVGPSSGFAWAEDGAFTLQVDVPSKAGRDVALVSIFWFAPWYPDAFTAYNVAS